MRAQAARVVMVIGLLAGPALAQSAGPPPDLDCSEGFDGLRATATSLAGARLGNDGRFDLVTLEAPDTWKVEFAFTAPGQAAHPAVTLRTFLKQVTGVWTAQSKGCGFGDQRQFAALMADMKERDSDLTNASRAAVEKQKQDASPLGATP